jgi:WD40 repeat protein
MDLNTHVVMDEYEPKVTDLSFRSDGQILASSNEDGLIRIYKVYTTIYDNLPFQEHHGKGYGVSLAFSPANDFIASTTSNKEITGDTRIELWNAEDFTFLGYLDLPVENDERTITSLEFSIHGDILVAGASDGQIYFWDTATRELLGDPIPSPSGVVRFTPDGKRLISVDPANTVRVWNIEEDDQSNIIIDRDYQDFEIHEEPNLLLTILPQGESCPFIISPDGKYIAIEGTGNSIKLLDLETFTEIGDPLEGMPSQVTDFTFSPDGSIVAVGGNDGSILLWGTDTQQRIGEALTGHQDAVIKLIFNKDGTVLYSASDDGTIRLWDTETQLQIGEPISSNAKSLMAEFPGFDPLTASSGFSNARILDMETSPNGSILVVSNEHQVLWALDLSVETWIKNACFITGRNLTPEEWNIYLGNMPNEVTCLDLTVE